MLLVPFGWSFNLVEDKIKSQAFVFFGRAPSAKKGLKRSDQDRSAKEKKQLAKPNANLDEPGTKSFSAGIIRYCLQESVHF